MSPRAAFLVMTVIGVLYAIVGLFNDVRDAGLGVSIAAIGVIGAEFFEWRGR